MDHLNQLLDNIQSLYNKLLRSTSVSTYDKLCLDIKISLNEILNYINDMKIKHQYIDKSVFDRLKIFHAEFLNAKKNKLSRFIEMTGHSTEGIDLYTVTLKDVQKLVYNTVPTSKQLTKTQNYTLNSISDEVTDTHKDILDLFD